MGKKTKQERKSEAETSAATTAIPSIEKVKEEEDTTEAVYTQPVSYVFNRFSTSTQGLSSAEAARRYNSKAPDDRNELAESEEKSLILEYLEKYTDPMVVLLLISAGISIAMGQLEDAASIVLAVAIVTTVGFVQEYKSEKAVDALKDLVAHHCVALRDGTPSDILAAELVEGDVIQLAAGMRVPADIRIIDAEGLSINESLLTGEPEPVAKVTGELSGCGGENVSAHLAERVNMAYMGTSVAAGTGAGVVCAVGRRTELGKLSEQLQDKEKKTPLQMSMDDFGKQLSLVSIIAIVVISLVGLVQGKPALQMFNMAVSLIVAAIPEGLPIAVTVTLALGVTRMSARNAIVRKLPAVEALGATNVICVDKTGTLTQNQMTVAAVYDTVHSYTVTHDRDSLIDGSVTFTEEEEEEEKIKAKIKKSSSFSFAPFSAVDAVKNRELYELLRATTLCNDAEISSGSLVGQPTEGGLLGLAHKAGMPDFRRTTKRVSKAPFDSRTKYMGVLVEAGAAPPRYYYKGAAEVLVPRCRDSQCGALDKHAIDIAAQAMAARSLRVIAVASSADPLDNNNNNNSTTATTTTPLTFLGLVGLRDPPREGVREAIRECADSGVRVVMITGDSKETAVAVADELGIAGPAMSAADLAENPAAETVRSAGVFYRMTPALKVSVVEAHSRTGAIVAMTGDGVNDAPALNKANIGIAMGRGSDVCKEASEIILVDNNFSTIVAAIEEGKVIFENIQNFLHFQLSTSIAAMLLTAVCSVADLPIPINPTQILLINIIMDGPPAQSLTFEKFRAHDAAARTQPPRDPRAPIVSFRMLAKILAAAVIMVLGTVAVFLAAVPEQDLSYGVLSKMDEAPRFASTMAFTTFVFYQMFNAMNCRSLTKSAFTIGLTSNHGFLLSAAGTLLAQLAVIYCPPLQSIFRTTAISFTDFVTCILVASSVWLIDELWKLVMRYH